MSGQVPTKIVLKSTTKMSLNDRFTSIQQHARPQPQPTVQNIRTNMVAQQQASAANRRLAQQLAHRPGVNMNMNSMNQYPGPRGGGRGMGMDNMNMGGIGMNNMGGMGMNNMGGMGMNNMGGMNMPPPQQEQRSLKQRLGKANVKARLNLDAVGRGAGMMMRGGRGQMNFSRGGPRGGFRGQGQGAAPMMRGRGGRGLPRGMNPGFRGQRGVRGGGRGMMRGGFNRGRGAAGGGLPRGGGGGGFRGQGQRGNRGRGGRGRGRGRGGPGGNVSQAQLDNQLDEYMSKTKSHLDTELDSYMAEANP
ncbi:chromatin target of PRMT1 protein-like isoform X3 [Littorina saxatilis]|uniref:Chromatin target of PRMT1 protein C-terminal domain-containing protein n=1 Tax=Littorina saxatilis TaxID=31220 RepID=A0AAN9AZS6_9CAEN